ncbi:hypothetical protein KGF56_001083 [Candida oxycetoniae]|uniref:GH16 domain-containing protein n=1 Tax=Candida oxycetoniae TaxID=497107 RepID=A0AAI9T103_9ASCO|nr:uncharacterized protein KGF56_001083 [Candida oxycetoniae]KAI3406241.2 hypothetical protein KGF56_001083 [Candida oxycetoniae]
MATERDLTSNTPRFSIRSPQGDGPRSDDQETFIEYDSRNPFADDFADISSFSSSSQNQRLQQQQQQQQQSIQNLHQPPLPPHLDNSYQTSQYGKPITTYDDYNLNNNSSSHLIQENSSTEDSRFLNKDYSYNNYGNSSTYSNNKLSPGSPAEFDRYPSMAGSRVVSSTSLVSQLYPQQGNKNQTTDRYSSQSHSSNSLDGSSVKSLPIHPNDLSPFGGYPESSFPLSIDEKEPDDYLHNPDPVLDAEYDKNRFLHDIKNLDKRSLGGLLGLIGMALACLAVFVVLPAVTYTGVTDHKKPEVFEILTHYSYPMLSAIRQTLIDPDTPEEAMQKVSRSGEMWPLVFSDEFNAEGRTFYEGDDQFFTAPDLHYDATKDLEWYDPDAVTTKNGTLTLQMDAFKNHNLFYRSGMIQSWNKMCFTQGRIEISAKLPNYGNVTGLWPGLWTMGNLGRPGYLASTEGVWPYTYDSCDAGITPNQSSPDGISYLPGQRLNKCTCPGESHPNPGVGRGAPEIDIIEGEVMTDSTGKKKNNGVASQSLQLAPMDIWYMPDYDFIEIRNASISTMNTYAGGPFQQAFSATTMLNTDWYEKGEGPRYYQNYGYEYLNDDDLGYIRWYVGQDPTLTVHSYALHPDGNINWRRIAKEPMSIIMNLGISNNWAYIDWNSISFPVIMQVDYVRVYQPSNATNVGCDPDDYPTYDYIQQHLNVYENVNLTSFEAGGYTFPKNTLTGCH